MQPLNMFSDFHIMFHSSAVHKKSTELLYAGPSCKKTSFGYTQDRKPASY